MKIYCAHRSQSKEEILDSIIGKDIWIRMTSDWSQSQYGGSQDCYYKILSKNPDTGRYETLGVDMREIDSIHDSVHFGTKYVGVSFAHEYPAIPLEMLTTEEIEGLFNSHARYKNPTEARLRYEEDEN